MGEKEHRHRVFCRLEKWCIFALAAFVVGWLCLRYVIVPSFDTRGKSLREKEIMRLLNDSLYNDAASIHLPAYVDKVKIINSQPCDGGSIRSDSVSCGACVWKFEFRIKSETYGKSWHGGTVEERPGLEYANLTFSLKD